MGLGKETFSYKAYMHTPPSVKSRLDTFKVTIQVVVFFDVERRSSIL